MPRRFLAVVPLLAALTGVAGPSVSLAVPTGPSTPERRPQS